MSYGFVNLPKAKWADSGRQVILKDDFSDVEAGLLEAHGLIRGPDITWVDTTSIKVLATADTPAAVLMSGFPNILHPGGRILGGLTDGIYRANIADVTMDFDVAASLWGTEKASQWSLIYAIAGDEDTTFTIKAMPIMRYSSQALQVITLRNNLNAADIGYGFTTNELIDGAIYILSGTSKGLLRSITANNNDNSTGGTITYGGTALTLSTGDWFVVLPPLTNFRLIGLIWNDASSNILHFTKKDNRVIWLERVTCLHGGSPAVVEVVPGICPLAVGFYYFATQSPAGFIAHKDYTTDYWSVLVNNIGWCPVEFCKFYTGGGSNGYVVSYEYPPAYGL